MKDPLYEELKELLSSPMTMAEILKHFQHDDITRHDVANRLRKGTQGKPGHEEIWRISPGTQYRARISSKPSTDPADVLHNLMFLLWRRYEAMEKPPIEEPNETSFLMLVKYGLRVYNKKYERNFQLIEMEQDEEQG